MRIKNLFITLGLAVAAAAAIGAGLKASGAKEVKATKVTDSSIEIRFTRPNESSWTSHGVSLHTFESGGTPSTSWPGYNMSFAYNNEDNQSVYVWHPSEAEPLYGRIIFNNQNNGQQTAEIAAPTSSKGFYKNGDSVGEYDLESKYYFYDCDGAMTNLHVYAWNNGDNSINNTWPGVNMTAESLYSGNGYVYSISLDVKYNRVQFNKGNNSLELNAGQPTNKYSYVYAPTSHIEGENTWWSNINYVYAHNWAENLMLFKTVGTNVTTDTGACETAYSTAKTVYNYFKANNEYVLTEIKNNFADALTRMSAWATHNHETFIVSNGVGTFSSNSPLSIIGVSNNNSTLIIVVISALVLVSTGGFFFLRKKQENE